MDNKSNKIVDKLFTEYLDFVSSTEESDGYLRENGLDPDELVNEGLRKAKQIQMHMASQKTQREYEDLKSSLLQKAKDEVAKLLSDVSFSLEGFIKRENINLAYKNFEGLNETEVREFLERHYLLKLENESKEKTK